MTTYVALLRGINVGGKNLIAMPELAACFEELGHEDVRTYLNTGNVVFRSGETDARTLEPGLEVALDERLGTPVRVVVRDREEIDAVVEAIDATWPAPADEKRNVIFLAHEADDERVLEQFRPKSEIESVRYVPGALLWSARNDGLTRSQMLKLSRFDVYQSMTIRSPNTVKRIHALMAAG